MKTRKVVIIGAGHVGSHVALGLIQSGEADDIVLIDILKEKAAAQALDLDDCVAVDLKHLSQAALRGQHAAGRQRTAHDLRAKLIHDLQIDRYFALFIQLDVHAFSFRAQRLVK